MMYMMDLQGKTKGLSIGGLTVISKSLSLTVPFVPDFVLIISVSRIFHELREASGGFQFIFLMNTEIKNDLLNAGVVPHIFFFFFSGC